MSFGAHARKRCMHTKSHAIDNSTIMQGVANQSATQVQAWAILTTLRRGGQPNIISMFSIVTCMQMCKRAHAHSHTYTHKHTFSELSLPSNQSKANYCVSVVLFQRGSSLPVDGA